MLGIKASSSQNCGSETYFIPLCQRSDFHIDPTVLAVSHPMLLKQYVNDPH